MVALLRPIGGNADEFSKRLIDEFGTLGGVLAAAPSALRRVLPESREAVRHLSSVRRAMLHALRKDATQGPVLGDPRALACYLMAVMGHEPAEQLRIVYLTAKNRVLRDELAGRGSVTELPILARPILIRALELGAAGLILVHNHPSGDPRPSRSDIQATRRIADAATTLEIVLHDHIVVSRSGWTSFRELELL